MAVHHIAVIGSGTMGAGIAQIAAAHGHPVHLKELDAAVAHRAVEGVGRQLAKLVEKGKLTSQERDRTLSNLKVADQASDLAACDLVIEAIIEDLPTKIKVLSEVLAHCSPTTILASNTSSLSIGKIGEGIGVPERTVGMHFFNPAPVMPLVEVISSPKTRPDVADAVASLATSWGKTVVRAKDTPGFIVNRVARGYYLEALRMLGEGVAGVEEIDGVMRQVGAFRMGPFELMDLVGIDVNYAVSGSVWEQMGRPARLQPHPIQADLVKAGRLGRKTKHGVYDYSVEPHRAAYPVNPCAMDWSFALAECVSKFITAAGYPTLPIERAYIVVRILAAIMNEAALALAAGVATADHIDVAMKTGTNYPKGPLQWAAEIGYPLVRRTLMELNTAAGDDRFAPAPLFKE